MAGTDGAVQLPLDGSGKKVRTQTGMNRATDPTTHQEVHTVAGRDGDLTGVTPYGFLQATPEASELFYDPFDGATIDTAHRWLPAVVSGTGAAVTQPNGRLSITAGTAINGYAYVTSRPSFNALIPGFCQFSYAITLEAGAAANLGINAHRFWGLGTSNAAPTSAAPLINAVGFEIGTNGKMSAVVWSLGVRTFAVDLSSTGTGIATSAMPIDGESHRYLVQYRTDRIYWFIDGVMVANGSFVSPDVQTLPVRHSSVNHTTAPSGLIYSILGSVVADTANNHVAISDHTYSWRHAGITDATSITGATQIGPNDRSVGSALNVNPNAVQKATYKTTVRPTAAASTANTFQPRVGLHHLSTSTKTIRIRRIVVTGSRTAAISTDTAEVHWLTAAPTGTNIAAGAGDANSGYKPMDGRDSAGEASLTNTVTAATSAGLIASGLLATTSTSIVAGGGQSVYDWQESGETKPITLRAGVLEGIAVGIRSTVATTWTLTVEITFTEE